MSVNFIKKFAVFFSVVFSLGFLVSTTAWSQDMRVDESGVAAQLTKNVELFEQINKSLDNSSGDRKSYQQSMQQLDKIELESKAIASKLQVRLDELNKLLGSPEIVSYLELGQESKHQLAQQLKAYQQEKKLVTYQFARSNSLLYLVHLQQKQIARLEAKEYRTIAFYKNQPIYDQALWLQAGKEFKASFLTQGAFYKLLRISVALLAVIICFVALQFFWNFLLHEVAKLLRISQRGLAHFSLNYLFRFVLFALVLYWLTYQISSEQYPLATGLFRAMAFLCLSSGLLKSLVVSFLPEDAELSPKKQRNFHVIMGCVAMLVMLNNIQLWSLSGYYVYQGDDIALHSALNFLLGIVFCFLVLKVLPKEFKSELFAKVLHKEVAYFILRTATVIVSLLYPVFIFLGYINMSPNILINLFQVAVMFSVFSYVHKVLNHLFPIIRLAVRKMLLKRTEGEEVMPELLAYWSSVFFGAVLVVAGFITWLLIHGVPASALRMVYEQIFINGLPIGQNMRFSVSHLFWSVLTFLIIFYAARVLQFVLDTRVLSYTHLDFGTKQAIKTTVGYLGLALAFVMAIISIGFDMKTITFMLSGLSVGIGIGMKDMFMNFFSGFVLLIERPIKEGDYLIIDGKFGRVNKIRLRSTEVVLTDKTVEIVPNSQFVVAKITNGSVGMLGRINIEVTVPYEADGSLVERLLLEAAESVMEEAYCDIDKEPGEPQVRCAGEGLHGVVYKLRLQCDKSKLGWLRSDLMKRIMKEFSERKLIANSLRRDVVIHTSDEYPEPVKVMTTKQ